MVANEKKLKRISDFEWASVAQYLVYISGAVDLEEINSHHVISMSFGGEEELEKLVARKRRVLGKLKANMARLERFASKYRDDLEEGEISVLRGMYRQTKVGVEIVERHIETADLCQWIVQGELDVSVDKEGENELPF